jgi:hypothetical protein
VVKVASAVKVLKQNLNLMILKKTTIAIVN